MTFIRQGNIFVSMVGVEPALLAAATFKIAVATNYTSHPNHHLHHYVKEPSISSCGCVGIEPHLVVMSHTCDHHTAPAMLSLLPFTSFRLSLMFNLKFYFMTKKFIQKKFIVAKVILNFEYTKFSFVFLQELTLNKFQFRLHGLFKHIRTCEILAFLHSKHIYLDILLDGFTCIHIEPLRYFQSISLTTKIGCSNNR